MIRCFDLGTYDFWDSCDGSVFSCSILFLLTSLPLLLFLGEAERYASHLSYFVILGVVIMANGLNLKWILYCLIGYGLLYFLIEVCFLRDPRKACAAEDRKLLAFLRKQSSDKSRHLSISRPKHVAGLVGDQAKVLYPFHVKKEVKRGSQPATIAPNIPALIWFISTRWLRNLASTCWSSTKKNFRGSFRDGGSVRTGRNSIWAESFIRSSQEKILKLYSNLSKDLVGYGFFAALSKCASLLLLPVLTRLFSEDEYGTFDLILSISVFAGVLISLSLERALWLGFGHRMTTASRLSKSSCDLYDHRPFRRLFGDRGFIRPCKASILHF